MEIDREYQESYLSLIWHKFLRRVLGPLVVAVGKDYCDDTEKPLLQFKIQGGVFNIFCQEQRYMVRFSRWFLKNKHFVLYKFTCECDLEVDDNVKQVLEREVVFPDIIFTMFNKKHRMEILLNAYFDVVVSRLKRVKEIEKRKLT